MAQSQSVDRDCACLELCIFDVDYVGLSAFAHRGCTTQLEPWVGQTPSRIVLPLNDGRQTDANNPDPNPDADANGIDKSKEMVLEKC
jgi:hypothetical protein